MGRSSAGLLFVAPNWLGDVVMSLPVLDLLAPAGVTVAMRRAWAPLLAGDPRLAGLTLHERGASIPDLARRWRRVGAKGVLLAPPSLRVALAALLARVQVRAGLSTDGRGPFLTVAQPPARPRGSRHYTDEMMNLGRRLLAALGLEAADVGGWPRLPALAGLCATDLGPGPPAWAVGAGTTFGPAKTWPAERLAEFVDDAVGRHEVRVLLLGDGAARIYVRQVRAKSRAPWRHELPGGAAVVDLVGRTALLDVAAHLRAVDVFVGNDSGLMHLAAALDVPTIGLFGSSSPGWTAPRGRWVRAVAATGFACHPCFRSSCNQPRFCLDTIGAPAILALAREAADTKGHLP